MDISDSQFNSIVSMNNTVIKNATLSFSQLSYFVQFPIKVEEIRVKLLEESNYAKKIIGLSSADQKEWLKRRIKLLSSTLKSNDLDSMFEEIEIVIVKKET